CSSDLGYAGLPRLRPRPGHRERGYPYPDHHQAQLRFHEQADRYRGRQGGARGKQGGQGGFESGSLGLPAQPRLSANGKGISRTRSIRFRRQGRPTTSDRGKQVKILLLLLCLITASGAQLRNSYGFRKWGLKNTAVYVDTTGLPTWKSIGTADTGKAFPFAQGNSDFLLAWKH